jgi:translation initiation factor 2B subunit (eIF-2B alpha/beta/delta family)
MAGLQHPKITQPPTFKIPVDELKVYQEIIQKYNMEEDLPPDLVNHQNELIKSVPPPEISNINTINTINQIVSNA